jgi:hypothetical protein
MGANAGTAVPTYASGEVLTAANLNLTNSGTPVFADSSARDGAFGSGKKVLAEGQLAYLEDSNVVQYYDGSSWATLGPASPGALTFISNTAFSTVSSVSLPSGTFSATYNNYLVLFNLTAASTTITLTGRMRVNNADDTTSNYGTTLSRVTSANAIGQIGNAGQTSFSLSTTDNTPLYGASFVFSSPFSANKTTILATINAVEAGVAGLGLAGSLTFNTTTSFDSFSFIANTGTISGNVRVYGYADS